MRRAASIGRAAHPIAVPAAHGIISAALVTSISNFNAPRRFHAPAYQRPSGWYSRHWTFGEILPSLFWTRNYWLNDYMDSA